MWFLLQAINSRPCNNFLTVCYSSTEPTMGVYNKPFHAVPYLPRGMDDLLGVLAPISLSPPLASLHMARTCSRMWGWLSPPEMS